MTIRPRFGQTMLDARTPSNLEVFFEFLDVFDEVPMPDGRSYRIKDGLLGHKYRNGHRAQKGWYYSELNVQYFMDLVKDFSESDWQDLRDQCIANSTINLERMASLARTIV